MASRSPSEQAASLDGLEHHLLVWDAEPGAPSDLALVLLHGFLDLARSFEPLVAALPAPLPRVVAPDWRGHGRSQWIGAGGYYHFPDYVADLHALLGWIGAGRVGIVGHSMGGSAAVLYAGAFPGAVWRLALIEGLGPHATDEAFPDRIARWIAEVDDVRARPRRPMPSIDAAAERLRVNNPRLPPDEARRLAEAGTRPVEGGLVWSFDPLHRTRAPVPFNRAGFLQSLERIACPVLIVDGAESGKIPDWPLRRAALRDCAEVVIPDAGHMVHQDAPVALAAVLAPFFEL